MFILDFFFPNTFRPQVIEHLESVLVCGGLQKVCLVSFMFASSCTFWLCNLLTFFYINPVCCVCSLPCEESSPVNVTPHRDPLFFGIPGRLATACRNRCIQSAALFTAARELNCTVSEILVNSQTAVCSMHANVSGAERRAALLIHYIGQFLSSAHSVSTLPSPLLTSQFFLREREDFSTLDSTRSWTAARSASTISFMFFFFYCGIEWLFFQHLVSMHSPAQFLHSLSACVCVCCWKNSPDTPPHAY